jgi:hypothetical protein
MSVFSEWRKSFAKLKGALNSFICTINETGGVEECADGTIVPVGDFEWSGLGAAYMEACEAMGVEPKMRRYDWEVTEGLVNPDGTKLHR